MASRPDFDYEMQVWIVDGIIQPCGHPDSMKVRHACCNAWLYRNMAIGTARDMWEKSHEKVDRIIAG